MINDEWDNWIDGYQVARWFVTRDADYFAVDEYAVVIQRVWHDWGAGTHRIVAPALDVVERDRSDS